MEKILIVEDDKDISDLLSINLTDAGYETDFAYQGDEGLLKALNNKYSLIVLDIRLPKMGGLEICRHIRMENNTTTIIILTSKSEEIDKVVGLELGADDYITKPFSIREFLARVKAVIRRYQDAGKVENKNDRDNIITIKDLFINVEKRIVEIRKKRVELSPKEFDLLILLASNPGRTYTRMELLNRVWGYEFEGFEHTVNSHINRLRSKIESDMNNPDYILTTWGVGYKFWDNE